MSNISYTECKKHGWHSTAMCDQCWGENRKFLPGLKKMDIICNIVQQKIDEK